MSFLCHHQKPYSATTVTQQKSGEGEEGTHDIIVCNLATAFPSGPIFSSKISSHSSEYGSMSIGSWWMETSGMIFQLIAPGTWFAAIPDSMIFWCMTADRPVVNGSTKCVLITRELQKLTTLLLLFFPLLPYLVEL